MSSVVYFEIPVDDIERACKFYNMLFGWRPEKVPGPSGYWFVHTKKSKDEYGIDGGFSRRKNSSEHIVDYIEVKSVDDCLKKVEQLGGKVVEQKAAVPKMGWYAICHDTEENTFGIWQSDENAM